MMSGHKDSITFYDLRLDEIHPSNHHLILPPLILSRVMVGLGELLQGTNTHTPTPRTCKLYTESCAATIKRLTTKSHQDTYEIPLLTLIREI